MMARNISPVVFTCLYLLLEKSIDFTGGDNNQSRIPCLSCRSKDLVFLHVLDGKHDVTELRPCFDQRRTVLMLGRTLGSSRAHTRKEEHSTAVQSTESTLLLLMYIKWQLTYTCQKIQRVITASFLWPKQLNYDITAILHIWLNTQVNPVELGTNQSRIPWDLVVGRNQSTCFKTESTNEFSIISTPQVVPIFALGYLHG